MKKSESLERDFSQELSAIKAEIRERSPEMLKENHQRTMFVLRDYYESQETLSAPKNIFSRLRNSFSGEVGTKKESFEEKTQRFKEFYDENLFSFITHRTKADIAINEGDPVTLRSPESGVEMVQSGQPDIEIGSTQQVFASMPLIVSRGGRLAGDKIYEIDPSSTEHAYAVPADHADYRLYDIYGYDHTRHSHDEFDTFSYKAYKENLYTLGDFQEVFSAYTSCFFESPQEAIKFLNNRHINSFPPQADAWSQEGINKLDIPEEDKDKLSAMRELLKKANLIPPITPEIMFKDTVVAYKSSWNKMREVEDKLLGITRDQSSNDA